MERYLYQPVLEDLKKRMVFLTGPRQVGKTYLARDIQKAFGRSLYLNNDDVDDSMAIRRREWPLDMELIVLDEIHKLKDWKNYLKGTFDTRRDRQTFLVTGSARLDTFRQTGDSLAGRYFLYHLSPLSVRELVGTLEPYEAVSVLNRLGGFPEPFLSASDEYAQRWRRQYYTDIVREDILDFSRIHEIRSIHHLLEMLRARVGSPLSYAALAEDLQLSPNTVRKYVEILESLHIVFLVRPYHRHIARALLKEPKIYFYDSGYVQGDEVKRLKNTAAVCLIKHVQYLQDAKGREATLHYLRTKEGKEVDFVLARDGAATHMLEIKLSGGTPARNLEYFKARYPAIEAVQLVHNLLKEKEAGGLRIVRAGDWLSRLSA